MVVTLSEGNHEKNVEQLVEKLVEGLKQLADTGEMNYATMAVASQPSS